MTVVLVMIHLLCICVFVCLCVSAQVEPDSLAGSKALSLLELITTLERRGRGCATVVDVVVRCVMLQALNINLNFI
jgi:hypothetical protein